MHSTEFTRLAQAADNNGWTIVAMCEIPPSPGSYPSAWVICDADVRAPREYLVTMGVMPEADEDRDAFFTWSTYDLTRDDAQRLFDQKNAEEIRKAG